MQVNGVSPQQQSFGMAFQKMDKNVLEVVNSRIKEKDVAAFKELIKAQDANKNVGIVTFADGKNRLSANIFPLDMNNGVRMISLRENWLEALRSPIHFIKTVCQKADKMSKEVESKSKISDAINSLNTNI